MAARMRSRLVMVRTSRTGEVHAVDEDVLKVGMGGEGDMLDAPRDQLRAVALRFGEEGELGPQEGGVAHVAHARLRQRRNEADPDGARDGKIVAEPARRHELGDLVLWHARDALEHGRARGDGALAELHLADVVLGQEKLLGRPVLAGTREDHRALVPALDHASGESGRKAIEVVEVDEPRAADALGRRLADGVEREVASVEADAVDGAEGRAHAVADLRALEGGAGGRRARPEMLARA